MRIQAAKRTHGRAQTDAEAVSAVIMLLHAHHVCMHSSVTYSPPHATPPHTPIITQAWISESSVLVGTKCNSLLQVDILTGAHRRVPLPPKPAVRLGPNLMHNPDGHCGMHAMDVSPDGRYVVAGGAAAEDAVVLRRGSLTPVQTFSVSLSLCFLGVFSFVAVVCGCLCAVGCVSMRAMLLRGRAYRRPGRQHASPPLSFTGPRRLGVWVDVGE